MLIGSTVYGSKWRSEAVDFVEANQVALQRVPVALFSVCQAGLTKDQATLSKHMVILNADGGIHDARKTG